MAKNVIRVALPNYDAFTDTNPDHFALYSDEDDVLIKEFKRGSATLNASESLSIPIGFTYIPLFFVYYNDGDGKWKIPYTPQFALVDPIVYADKDNVYITSAKDNTEFKYYIFYDQEVEI